MVETWMIPIICVVILAFIIFCCLTLKYQRNRVYKEEIGITELSEMCKCNPQKGASVKDFYISKQIKINSTRNSDKIGSSPIAFRSPVVVDNSLRNTTSNNCHNYLSKKSKKLSFCSGNSSLVNPSKSILNVSNNNDTQQNFSNQTLKIIDFKKPSNIK